jgi:hypothetical protein
VRAVFAMFLPATIFATGLVPALFDLTNLSTPVRVLIVVVAWCLSVASMYLSVYLPLTRRVTERQKLLANVVVEQFTRRYYDYTQADVSIRVNVMLAYRTLWGPWKRHLRMWFAFGDYSKDERSLEFPLGTGICGKAFADNTSYWYDREKGHDQFVVVPPFAPSVTRNLVSILSVPIYHPEDQHKSRPIGVLNVDASKDVEHTGFDDSNVRRIAKETSALIGVILE